MTFVCLLNVCVSKKTSHEHENTERTCGRVRIEKSRNNSKMSKATKGLTVVLQVGQSPVLTYSDLPSNTSLHCTCLCSTIPSWHRQDKHLGLCCPLP